MLERLYDLVQQSVKLGWGVLPDDYQGTKIEAALSRIFNTLQEARGHKDFVRAKTLRPCDFYIPSPGLIVEFDESQHFTLLRKVSLDLYPPGVALGFDIARWRYLCEQTKARDPDPPFRDEQRAWYDTLRDLVPGVKGLLPTIRLYSKECQWCRLNQDNPSDVERFKSLVGGKSERLGN